MEKAKTSEYRPFCRDHKKSVANHLEVDAERNPDGLRRERPGREPDQPCESFPACTQRALMTAFFQAVGCRWRCQLSSRERYHPRKLEGGGFLLWVVVGLTDDS